MWVMAVVACTGAGPGPQPPPPVGLELLTPPQILDPDNPSIHLAKRLHVTSSVPTSAVVVLDDGEQRREVAFPGLRAEHDLPLLGLLAGVEHVVTLTLTATDSASIERTLSFTPELPPLVLPHVEVLQHDPARAAPGYTLVPGRGEGLPHVLIAYDAQGRSRWIYDLGGRVFAASQQPDGTLSALVASTVTTFDPLGEVYTRWAAAASAEGSTEGVIPIEGIEPMHHEFVPLDDGSFWSLTPELLSVEAYPVSERRPDTLAPAEIMGDVAVHVAADGTLLDSIALSEVLPTSRIGYGSLTPDARGFDWSHANAVWPLPDEDAIVISARHLDTVVKIDLTTREPVWILAPHEGWPPSHEPYLLQPPDPEEADFAWAFHQHAPMIDGDRILLFDNGNHDRQTPYVRRPRGEGYSRLVEYTIDEEQMTIEQTFSWGEALEHPLYSVALGNADYLDSGNVLGTFAYLRSEEGIANPTLDRGDRSMHVVEIDHATEEPVWQLLLYADRSESSEGWYGDRATRVRSLYGEDVIERVLP